MGGGRYLVTLGDGSKDGWDAGGTAVEAADPAREAAVVMKGGFGSRSGGRRRMRLRRSRRQTSWKVAPIVEAVDGVEEVAPAMVVVPCRECAVAAARMESGRRHDFEIWGK